MNEQPVADPHAPVLPVGLELAGVHHKAVSDGSARFQRESVERFVDRPARGENAGEQHQFPDGERSCPGGFGCTGPGRGEGLDGNRQRRAEPSERHVRDKRASLLNQAKVPGHRFHLPLEGQQAPGGVFGRPDLLDPHPDDPGSARRRKGRDLGGSQGQRPEAGGRQACSEASPKTRAVHQTRLRTEKAQGEMQVAGRDPAKYGGRKQAGDGVRSEKELLAERVRER